MSTFEAIKEYLSIEGYRPQEEDGTMAFKAEDLTYFIFKDDNDEQFLNINLPGVFQVDENNALEVLAACNRVNNDQKVVKAIVKNDSVWICLEQLLDSDPQFDDIIPRSIQMIHYAFFAFGKAMGLIGDEEESHE